MCQPAAPDAPMSARRALRNTPTISRPGQSVDAFPSRHWEEAMDRAAQGLVKVADLDGPRALAGSVRERLERRAYRVSETRAHRLGSNNVDHCTRLCHASSVAACSTGVGSAAVTATFNEENSTSIIVDRRQPDREPSVAGDLLQAAQNAAPKLIVMDPRGQSR